MMLSCGNAKLSWYRDIKTSHCKGSKAFHFTWIFSRVMMISCGGMPGQTPRTKAPRHIFFLILLLTPYWKLKFWNLLVPSERSSSDLSEYTIFQIVAKLFRFVARVRILSSRPSGSREVLVSVSESSLSYYSIFLTLAALFLCSYIVSIYFYPRIKC